jgi:coenzyme F420-reducing hydrogenase gamma subunit
VAPRVVIISLASDFGCQLQMTNIEDQLLDILGRIDLTYWQLASSAHMPDDYDIAIVEGAVCMPDHVDLLKTVRETADVVIAVGACAMNGGIPALAAVDVAGSRAIVYGDGELPLHTREAFAPTGVTSVIDIDYLVPGCPIDSGEYVAVLSRALLGLHDHTPIEPMCASCKINENVCFFESDQICLGVVTRTGCGARCVTLGRPCTGCRGLAPDANLVSARHVFAEHGYDLDEVLATHRIYNSAEEAVL